MVALSANQGWFEIEIEGGPEFGVYGFTGRERLNEPFEFAIELVSKDANIDLIRLLGRQALLTVADQSGQKRLVNGQIREAFQLHTSTTFTHYKIILVPRLWFLGQNREHRVFQHLSVPQIIESILKEQNFIHESYSFKLKETYPELEYRVQYGESDLYFISRLCEEEGIYFFFEHAKGWQTVCFSDASGGADITGESDLRFFPGSGHQADTAVTRRLDVHQRINSDVATYREWNFDKPSLNLEVSSSEPDQHKAPAPGGLSLETYGFPHLYDLTGGGERYARIQIGRQLTFSRWAEGEGDVSRWLPGFSFKLHDHPRAEANGQWWLTGVDHEGEQPQVLEGESPDRGFSYRSRFVAIPFETRFIPEARHPKIRIDGLQSAIVTGPAGEEVYADKYGRVKVLFHWDRLGPKNERSSLWVRVADPWAGRNFGFIQIPRIGQEVLVEFMEGDPDRPVITGRVYNAENTPPWNLPGQKTLSGIQSREFMGGQRNQLVMDDTQGQVQAQLSSDHLLSQLNLGYLTRINHLEGRRDFRGEGFELRTDGWGVIRAARGLVLTTDARRRAGEHHKDTVEAANNLRMAADLQKNHAELAEVHNARDYGPEVKPLTQALTRQAEQLAGPGPAHEELTSPHLVLSSPAGLALTSPESAHIHAGDNLALTSERQISVASNRGFFVTALKRVSLFAHRLGLKLFAGAGKVEIQAQSDNIEMIADKVINIISAKDTIQLSSPKEIILTANGSYIKIDSSGVESGTNGKFTAHASAHNFVGPATKETLTVSWRKADPVVTPRVVVRDPLGHLVDVPREAKNDSAEIKGDASEHLLQLFQDDGPEAEMTVVEGKNRREVIVDGFKIKLTKDKATKDD
ncbi:MAG: type VI secretion system tip protein VgrG [Deltaproteobacteria bacterium]|jgi:type VI secretion system secreted protein VgrG|nr:type VI secretion system tip protein VgrG [Deltaproteobacteria bacterium]